MNKISHDPEEGPWMTRDRRGRARREEEVTGNPPVSGPAGEDGTLPILEVDIASINHFPSLPLPAGAPLGQGDHSRDPPTKRAARRLQRGVSRGYTYPSLKETEQGRPTWKRPRAWKGRPNLTQTSGPDSDIRSAQLCSAQALT